MRVGNLAEFAGEAVDEEEAGFEGGGVGDVGFEAVEGGVHGAGDSAGVGRLAEEGPGFERLAEFDDGG